MSLFALGDLHLSLGTDKPMDIFKGWSNYTERIEQNWNSVVSDEDTVVVVGDISWAMHLKNTVADFDFVNNKLKGNKIFIKGNHDYWWETKSKMDRFLEENGFDRIKILNNNAYLVEGVAICGTRGWINDDSEPFDQKLLNREAGRLEMSVQCGLKLGGTPMAFVHYPLIFGTEKNYYLLEVLNKYNITECFYGHIHGAAVKKAFIGESNGVNHHIVSSDCVNFTPVPVKI